ncbi:hypothetical protein [Kitasatospora sp. MBT63]|uniref:hypothetical protein n=1 Tax=Kitasatospora sp. MBT63 TaxID=1444768 RepID=UPI00068B6A3C|nr:hypothetical protein [Kitasatospora sp. MBT63]
MNSSTRTFGLPALAAAVLIGACSCAAPATPPSSPQAPGGDAAALAPPTSAARAAAGSLVVTAAQPGAQQVAIGKPGAGATEVAPVAADLRLASYDPGTGRAVLSGTAAAPTTPAPAPTGSPAPKSAPPAAPPATPATSQSASPQASPTPSAAASLGQVQVGRLIASPPTPAAPKGALLAVTEVHPSATPGTVEVATRPATLPELLGGAEADGQVAVDPHAITITPLVKDFKLSFGQDGNGAKADASGTLGLDLNAPLPLPAGATAAASASLRLHPAVHFAYHGARAGEPRTASIGFDLGAQGQWKLSGELAKGTGTPLRIPVAELHANPVLTVAGLPVVVNLGLTCFLEVGADGKVTVDAEQEFTGAWSVHADYAGGKGWKPVTDAADTKVSAVRAHFAGQASVRAGLGADVSVGLYDAVGVEATVEPYLRSEVNGSAVLETGGAAPKVQGSWALYGGVDLTGALLAHLKIFGTPVAEKRLPLPVFHREWPLASAGTSAAPTAPVVPSAPAAR